ncbi:MAG: PEP-CTERM sorting domain-containing protein [Anaerohalosphaera sp.]|nr:PEP-CTERM sorting domain-containing protein [Anaerohalosphaera sp.]
MMKELTKSETSLFLRFLIVIAILMALPATMIDCAKAVTVDIVDIDPINPTDADIIKLTSSGWIGYAYDIEFIDGSSNISGNSIELDFFFYDSNPTGNRFPVAVEWSQTVDIAPLSPGTYDLTSTTWISYNPLLTNYQLSQTYSTSFTVVPEPTTVLILGMGGLLLRKRRA